MNKLTKTALILFILISLAVILYYGRVLLVPLAFGGILAMLYMPVAEWLQGKGMPKLGAILLCLLSLLLIIGLFVGVVIWQGSALANDWPKIKEELSAKVEQLEDWAISNIGIVSEERIQKIKENMAGQKQNYRKWIQLFTVSFIGMLGNILFTILYMVFLMLVSQRLTRFVLMIVDEGDQKKAKNVVLSSRKLVSSYFVGRLMLVGIQAVLFAVGFLIFGLPYAIPVGLLAGALTFIPYVGNLIGGGIAILIALTMGGDATPVFGVLGTMILAQFLENNILQPWLVGSEVNLNPFFTFFAVIAFSVVWGIAGTVLALPLVAIVKTVFDHVDGLRPLGYVLGTEKEGG